MKNCAKALLLFILCITTIVFSGFSAFAAEIPEEPAYTADVRVASRFLELLFGKREKQDSGGISEPQDGENPTRGVTDDNNSKSEDNTSERRQLILGGDVFGVRVKQKHPTVTDAGIYTELREGDVILSVNGRNISSADDFSAAVKGCGTEATLLISRDGEKMRMILSPKSTPNGTEIAITLREGAAGIGTITYIDPQSGCFGGLGHGISDADSGDVISISSGVATDVILGSLKRGECGKPGELCGILTDSTVGSIYANTGVGVFGKMQQSYSVGDLIEVGSRSDVTNGEATIVCTLRNGKKAEYKIEIFDIDESSEGTKSFKIRATDPALIAISGGIIRGMSGSPIVQNGKLIGAVTHVLVADPTEGYGIFIENMLKEAEKIK